MAVRLIKEDATQDKKLDLIKSTVEEMRKRVNVIEAELKARTGYDIKLTLKDIEQFRNADYHVDFEDVDVLDKCGIFKAALDECVLGSFSSGIQVQLTTQDKGYSLYSSIADAPDEVKDKVKAFLKDNDNISFNDVIEKRMSFDKLSDELDKYQFVRYGRKFSDEFTRLRLYHPYDKDVVSIWGSLDLKYHHKDGGSNGMTVLNYQFSSETNKFAFR